MLIVLKLDGQVDAPWSAVFIPLWMFMGAIALAGSALCCCAPMVSRGVIPEIRPLLIRGMLLCSVGTFRYICFFFFFLRVDCFIGLFCVVNFTQIRMLYHTTHETSAFFVLPKF